jgi:hypothetical protein
MSLKIDRLFVPLARDPYDWFRSGDKKWELRRRRGQFTERHVYSGRRVELRLGYSDRERAAWGIISAVVTANDLQSFFRVVPFREVIPAACSVEEAIECTSEILSLSPNKHVPLIGFRVELDRKSIRIDPKFFPDIQEGRKKATVRRGVRSYPIGRIVIESDEPSPRVLDVSVESIQFKAYEELTEEDARRDGYNSLADLRSELDRIYGDLSPKDLMTIVEFDIA